MSFFPGNGTKFQKKNTDGECCTANQSGADNFVTGIAFDFRSPDWFVVLTLSDGTTVETQVPQEAFTDVNVSEFTRHPQANTDPAFFYTIRITETDGSFYDLDLVDLFASITAEERIANRLRVAKNGDDSLALAAVVLGIYDEHIPFANPTFAMSVATAGQTVVVEPGLYTVGAAGADLTDNGAQVLCKDGATLHMMSGATLEYLPNCSTVNYFEDGANPATFNITGDGTFIFGRSIDSSFGIDNEETKLYWEYRLLDSKVRFRWQRFGEVSMIGNVIQRERGMISTRIVSSIVGTLPTRKKLTLKGRSWKQETFSNYDQIEVGYITNTDLVIDYDDFSYNTGSGGTIRLRSFNETNSKRIRIGHTTSNSGSIIAPFVYSDFDDSQGTIDVNSNHGNRVFRSAGVLNPLTSSVTESTFNSICLTGNSNNNFPFVFFNTFDKFVKVNLNVTNENNTPVAVNTATVAFVNAANTIVSGYIRNTNPNSAGIAIGTSTTAVDSALVQGTIKGLTIKLDSSLSPSIRNSVVPSALDLKVIRSESNTPVSATGGGVNQIIDTLLVDPLL